MSDSHGYDDNVRRVMTENSDADVFLHCGDLSSDDRLFPGLICVQGNNDYYSDFPDQRVLQYAGVSFLMIHSHRVPPIGRPKALAVMAKENNCSVVLYGHTHAYDDRYVDGIRLLNPGSLYYNRDMSKPGYMIITIDSRQRLKTERVYL
jgi:putative phosphoesterase